MDLSPAIGLHWSPLSTEHLLEYCVNADTVPAGAVKVSDGIDSHNRYIAIDNGTFNTFAGFTVSYDGDRRGLNGWWIYPREDGYYGGDNDRGYTVNLDEFFTDEDGVSCTTNARIGNVRTTLRELSDGYYVHLPVGETESRICRFTALADIDHGSFYIMDNDKNEYQVNIGMVRSFKTKALALKYLHYIKNEESIKNKQKERIKAVINDLAVGDMVELNLAGISQYSQRSSSRRVYGELKCTDSGIRSDKRAYKIKAIGNVIHSTLRKKAVTIILDTDEEVPSIFIKKIDENRFKELQYRDMSEKLKKNLIDNLRMEIATTNDSLETLLGKVIHKTREKNKLIDKLNDNSFDVVAVLQEQIEEIKKNKQVKSVEFIDNGRSIKIVSKNLYIKNIMIKGDGKDYDASKVFGTKLPLLIGQYEIIINLITAKVSCKRISKLPHLHDNVNHPHVSDHICWGNMKDYCIKALAEMDIITVVDSLFAILETIRVHDTLNNTYNFWKQWPGDNAVYDAWQCKKVLKFDNDSIMVDDSMGNLRIQDFTPSPQSTAPWDVTDGTLVMTTPVEQLHVENLNHLTRIA